MSLSTAQKRLLQQNIKHLKPNFHQFTLQFHTLANKHSLHMTLPSQESINRRSYLLFCALNKVVMHLDDLKQVTPFIEYLANNLSFLNVTSQDIDNLTNAFMKTVESMQEPMSEQLKGAWQLATRLFANIVKCYLFSYSNVIPLQDNFAVRRTS